MQNKPENRDKTVPSPIVRNSCSLKRKIEFEVNNEVNNEVNKEVNKNEIE